MNHSRSDRPDLLGRTDPIAQAGFVGLFAFLPVPRGVCSLDRPSVSVTLRRSCSVAILPRGFFPDLLTELPTQHPDPVWTMQESWQLSFPAEATVMHPPDGSPR